MTANDQDNEQGIELNLINKTPDPLVTIQPGIISDPIEQQTKDIQQTFKTILSLQDSVLQIEESLSQAENKLKKAQQETQNSLLSYIRGPSNEQIDNADLEMKGHQDAKDNLLTEIQGHKYKIEEGFKNLEKLLKEKIDNSSEELLTLTDSNSDLRSSITSLGEQIANKTQLLENQQMQIADTEAKIQRYQETKSKLQLALNTLDTGLEQNLGEAAKLKNNALDTAKNDFILAFEKINEEFKKGIQGIFENYKNKIKNIEANLSLSTKDKLKQLMHLKHSFLQQAFKIEEVKR